MLYDLAWDKAAGLCRYWKCPPMPKLAIYRAAKALLFAVMELILGTC